MKDLQKRNESPMRSAVGLVPPLLRYVRDPVSYDEAWRKHPATTERCYRRKLGLEVGLAPMLSFLMSERVALTFRPYGGIAILDPDPSKLPNYFEQIGSNNGYIIHPDEILADNFIKLVNEDKQLKTPKIVEQMESVLRP